MLHLLDQLNPLSPMRDQDRISPCNEINVKQINDKNKENICKTHRKTVFTSKPRKKLQTLCINCQSSSSVSIRNKNAFTTSSDPYTVTEQFKKKVLWGGGGGGRGWREGRYINTTFSFSVMRFY